MSDSEDELQENEEYIGRGDLDIQVMTGGAETGEQPCVYVKFTGFEDILEADEYADMLVESLPLLLFESTRLH
jgi:hypothetical protein